MKYIFSVVFIIAHLQKIDAQILQIGGTQYLNRLDYSYTEGFAGWIEPTYREFTRSSQEINLDILIYKGFYLNTGYLSQYTYTGFLVKHPDGAAAGESLASLWHTQIPIRIKYKYKLFHKWNRSIWVSTALGISYNLNKGYNDPFQNGSRGVFVLPASETRDMYYRYTYNTSFNKSFVLYRGDLEFGIDLMPWASLFFRIGGSLGNKTQAQHNIEYWFDDTGLLEGTVVNQGDNWYYGIGLCFMFFPKKDNWKELFLKKE